MFLHQPTLVVEYSSVEYVEFVKAPGTRNFDLVVALKTEKGESGKKHKFGSIEKKEFNLIAEFLKEKESFFSVRNYEPEAAEDEEDNDEEDDEDFNSDDGSEVLTAIFLDLNIQTSVINSMLPVRRKVAVTMTTMKRTTPMRKPLHLKFHR